MFGFIVEALAQPIGAIGIVPATPTVEITNLITTIIQGIGVMVLSAAALWVKSHLTDTSAQKTVLTAAENAVAYAENRLGVKGDQPYSVPVANSIGRLALSYMNTHVADSAKRLGLDDASLSRIIVAKMPDIKDGGIDEGTFNNIVASASGKPPAPVDYGQLLTVFGPMIKQMIIDHEQTANKSVKPEVAPAKVLTEPLAASKPEVG